MHRAEGARLVTRRLLFRAFIIILPQSNREESGSQPPSTPQPVHPVYEDRTMTTLSRGKRGSTCEMSINRFLHL